MLDVEPSDSTISLGLDKMVKAAQVTREELFGDFGSEFGFVETIEQIAEVSKIKLSQMPAIWVHGLSKRR